MPVQIGSLANVPAPGDPIRSPWAQDVTKLGVHRFDSKAALLAGWTAPPDGSWAYLQDEDTVVVRKAGSWRYYEKEYPHVQGTNTTWLTYAAASIVASSWTSLHLSGRRCFMVAAFGVTNPATSMASTLFATLAAPFWPTARQDYLVGTGSAAGAGSGRVAVINTSGAMQVLWTAGDNPAAVVTVYFHGSWTIPDLVVVS